MMVMMMVMVMAVTVSLGFHVTIFFMAMLAFALQFNGYVTNAMLSKLLADMRLDLDGILVGNGVKSCVMVASIQTPDVNVVNVKNTGDLQKRLPKLMHVDLVGRFFQKEVQGFF